MDSPAPEQTYNMRGTALDMQGDNYCHDLALYVMIIIITITGGPLSEIKSLC